MAPERKSTEKDSLAAAAGDQIRAIVEAAEQAAAQIRAQAEEAAARTRAQAEEEASGIRADARGDVRALLESIRSGLSRVTVDLEELEEKLMASGPDEEAAAPFAAPKTQDDGPPAARSSAMPAQSDPDLESARLVALNMALDGADRDEVERYLGENFALSDRKALLDEIYASVGR